MSNRLGYLKVTPHLINDKVWPEIEIELKKVFTEQGRSFDYHSGNWHIVGTSAYFAPVPEGNRVPCYTAIFTTQNGFVQFVEFKEEFNALAQ